jgi:hypothetical protein
MKRLSITALVFVLLLLIAGCGWNKVCLKELSTSYTLGVEKITVVGGEIVQTILYGYEYTNKYGVVDCVITKYEPTGLNLTLFKREPEIIDNSSYKYPFIPNKELLYAGKEGNILHITYREYTWKGLARTPFFQNLYYDLKTSNTIMFQNWSILVLDANNHQIRFKVIKE